jgi:hypothetical protein
MLLRFYNRYLPANRQLVYVGLEEPPPWLLLNRFGELGPVHDNVRFVDRAEYELDSIWPYSDLSGWHWVVYRRLSLRD